ncbi:MAG: hypothetical protein JW902_17215, partial [Syntrophaceae bacterium]|nr:hypothetical protein [Syntrophaceae bacterium]
MVIRSFFSLVTRASGWVVLTLALAGASIISGCSAGRSVDASVSSEPLASSTQQDYSPVKIAVFQDQTGSTSWTRTPQLTIESFYPLIELLGLSGGEIGVGLIRDRSNKSLLRLKIDPPPAMPCQGKKPSNPFLAAQYEASVKAKTREYEELLSQWQGEMEQRIAAFITALEPLMTTTPDAGHTDIVGAMN